MRENMLKTQQVLLENRCHTDISLTQEGVGVCVCMCVWMTEVLVKIC